MDAAQPLLEDDGGVGAQGVTSSSAAPTLQPSPGSWDLHLPVASLLKARKSPEELQVRSTCKTLHRRRGCRRRHRRSGLVKLIQPRASPKTWGPTSCMELHHTHHGWQRHAHRRRRCCPPAAAPQRLLASTPTVSRKRRRATHAYYLRQNELIDALLETEQIHRGEYTNDGRAEAAQVARAMHASFAANCVLLVVRVAIALISGSLSLVRSGVSVAGVAGAAPGGSPTVACSPASIACPAAPRRSLPRWTRCWMWCPLQSCSTPPLR